MKKLVSLLLVLVMVLGLCVGCGAKEKLDIGIVLPTKDEDRWLADEATFKQLIEEKGYKAEIMYSQADPAIEKSNVEALIEKGVKALIGHGRSGQKQCDGQEKSSCTLEKTKLHISQYSFIHPLQQLIISHPSPF